MLNQKSKPICNMAICLTCGEQSENHIGMQVMGSGLADKGFTINELLQAKLKFEKLGCQCELIRLDLQLSDELRVDTFPASVLIIRKGVDCLIEQPSKNMFEEQNSFQWDTKYWDTRRGRVLNKRARHNVCFGNIAQEPDYENKKGTIIAFDKVPLTNLWKNKLKLIFGEKANNLEVEGNKYYDIKKCGIGFHGDGERKKVIAGSLGASRPIHWQWYHKCQPIGPRIKFILNGGDMYAMSEKTTGYDWKKRNIKTLRHAAGEKYTK